MWWVPGAVIPSTLGCPCEQLSGRQTWCLLLGTHWLPVDLWPCVQLAMRCTLALYSEHSGILHLLPQVGIVSIPGMMTGQILSGSDPSQARRSAD